MREIAESHAMPFTLASRALGCHILVVLAEGSRHGRAMMQDVGQMTGAAPRPNRGYQP